MTAALSTLQIVVWGVITFSILVVLHEMGHFLAARAFGIKVHEFMIGLPGPALRLHTKNMAWGITAVPLGGYVRIAGMEPGPEDALMGEALVALRDHGPLTPDGLARYLSIERARAESLLTSLVDWKAATYDEASNAQERYRIAVDGHIATLDATALADVARATTYRGQPTWKRVTVLAMGVVTNLTLAILTFTLVLSIWGYLETTTTIATVGEGSPAEAAGIRPGDVLQALDGEPIETWEAFQALMADTDAGDTVTVRVSRDQSALDLTAVLAESEGHGFLGVGPKTVPVKPSLGESLGQSLQLTGLVFTSIVRLFDPRTFSATVEGVRGPVGISVMAAEAASAGPLQYAGLIAMLSLSLGAMNILPLPPLDGGKIALEILERLIQRPVSRGVSLGISAAGALLLFSLIGYIMYADIARLAR